MSDTVSKHYEIKDGKLERKRPFCNRCGRGYFMADHGDRYACGKCGYTTSRRESNPFPRILFYNFLGTPETLKLNMSIMH